MSVTRLAVVGTGLIGASVGLAARQADVGAVLGWDPDEAHLALAAERGAVQPTGGLDVSVQARLLDLVRGLVNDLGLAAIIVTHDLAVARLLSHRMMVMKDGHVIEHGLTDRVLDDPREPYTQLLVSSILQV